MKRIPKENRRVYNIHTTICQNRGQKIPFVDKKLIRIPARTSTLFRYYMKNDEIKEGYIPRLESLPGIYTGDILVKNNTGQTYFKAIYTSEN